MADILDRVFYGVWIRHRGWLKVQHESGVVDCYSDMNKDVVADTAARFHGELRYVDGSLYRLEAQILEQESADEAAKASALAAQLAYDRKRGSLWRTFKTWSVSLLRR